eukprot:705728-Amphidinium_carterae.2
MEIACQVIACGTRWVRFATEFEVAIRYVLGVVNVAVAVEWDLTLGLQELLESLLDKVSMKICCSPIHTTQLNLVACWVMSRNLEWASRTQCLVKSSKIQSKPTRLVATCGRCCFVTLGVWGTWMHSTEVSEAYKSWDFAFAAPPFTRTTSSLKKNKPKGRIDRNRHAGCGGLCGGQ